MLESMGLGLSTEQANRGGGGREEGEGRKGGEGGKGRAGSVGGGEGVDLENGRGEGGEEG